MKNHSSQDLWNGAAFLGTNEPIAIVGIGCRFPGGVDSPEFFWKLLKDQKSAITEVPADRFDIERFFDPEPATPGKVMTRWGGFLERIDRFDASFFGISPREAERLDPQQRLLLEVGWEAMEDAGLPPQSGTMLETGVFVGMWLNDFEARLFRKPDQVDFYMTTGSGRYSASGRLSFAFGLQGPSLTVDTACSSSLVAVHLACQSLRNRECRTALAGAANVILQPHITIAYSQSKMMAPDGKCKFGDASADGYVRSEGAAVILLKRLEDVLLDGDRIYAIILGEAVNNDGKTGGSLTTPGGAGQEDMLRKAYKAAGVLPGMVQYVEAHGPGTRAGDPVEINALGSVLKEGRKVGSLCSIGSIKTNLGHTEGAAGLAGLIKVALSIYHSELPASLHLKIPNPAIPWEELPVRIQVEHSPWPDHDGARLAGVSAFGIAGTNAHVVLAEAPEKRIKQPAMEGNEAYLLPLSARSPEALVDMLKTYQKFLAQPGFSLHDLCYSAARKRIHHDHRLAFEAASLEELRATVQDFSLEGTNVAKKSQVGKRKIMFVFPGQGSQWAGMGKQLYTTQPVFREMIDRCEKAFDLLTDWSLLSFLQAEIPPSRLNDIDVVQPMLFAIQVALAAQWQAWGIEAAGVVGHSLGEVAAAVVSGALSLEDGAKVICRRSQLMKRVSGKGSMAVVDLTYEQALQIISGYEGQLSIAVSNSPRSTVISGEPEAIKEVLQSLQGKNIFCRYVKVDVAAHSPQMQPLCPELVRALEGLDAKHASTDIYSTVTATKQAGEKLDAGYWGRNLREPVLFSNAIQQSLLDGYNTFIEISPHPILLQPIEQSILIAQENGTLTAEACTIASLRREEPELRTMLHSLGELYTWGYPVDWERIYPRGEMVRLPTYPWQRESYWLDLANVDYFQTEEMKAVEENAVVEEWMYQIEWETIPRSKKNVPEKPGTWLVVGEGEYPLVLRRRFEIEGYACEIVSGKFEIPAEDYQGIVYFRDDNQAAQGLRSVIGTIARFPSPPKLKVATRGSRPLAGKLEMTGLEQSLLWGMGLVIGEEFPDLWEGCVDVDPNLTAGEAAEVLLPEMVHPDVEFQIALYHGQRYAARLIRLPKKEKPQIPVYWKKDVAYLITGGMGGVGLHLAEWLAEQGVRRLILMGRTPLPPRNAWINEQNSDFPLLSEAEKQKIASIRRIEALGASVHLAFIDVADETQLKDYLEEYRKECWPPIRGVFHAAGATRDRLIAQMEAGDLDAVLRPKVLGAWLLHKYLNELDFFVMFSSIGSVLGQVGQGSYAAANAYLDSLAQYRRGQGLAGISINWGAWKDLGLLNTTGGQVVRENLEKLGIAAFNTQDGLSALGMLLSYPEPPTQAVVFPADWDIFQNRRKGSYQASFTTHLWKKGPEQSETLNDMDVRDELLAMVPGQRCGYLEAFIQQQVAQVLKLPVGRVGLAKPLGTLGLDSLMTIEFRNRLESALKIPISATFAWNYPTIKEMAPFLAEKMGIPLTNRKS